MQVYHVSLDTEGDMYKLFEPRIPWAMSEEEDAININTGKFHLPDCASVQKANSENIKL